MTPSYLETPEYETLTKEKACIFTTEGELLWRSPAWTAGKATPNEDHAVRGRRWLEFIYPEDVDRLLAWFRNDDEWDTISFFCMAPLTGFSLRCTYAKFRYGRHWLVLGEATLLENTRPASACVAYGEGFDSADER